MSDDVLASLSEIDFTTATLLAWHGKLDIAALFTVAANLTENRQNALSAVLYQTWLKRNKTPNNHLVYFNLGVILLNEGDLAGAREAYTHAVQLAPTFPQARFNLGLIYERAGENDAATAEWLWIESHVSPGDIEHRPILLLALNNLGRHFEDARRYAEATSCLTKSLHIEPNQPDVIHHLVFLREKQCLWPVYTTIDGVSMDLLRQSTSALAMLSLSDDPESQLAAARNYVKEKLNSNVPSLAPTKAYGHTKIRVAYCSSDFCRHPVGMLTAELFELHNREEFEVFGYCWTKEDGSSLRQRIIDGMDHFERIHTLSDEAAARLIRDHEIDILIDLQGQTLGARANMLAYRPAPIQITYLGLPATTGLPSIDYVIADRFLIPDEYARFYSEKPLYMPDIYQVSDRKRQSAPPPTRESCGLPDDAFVFCSFNNNFKFTPDMFDAWMKILQRVPGSVLWLLADNPWAQANLKREALARGIEENRLVFATRVSPENYLARYSIADLFLDSFPFNAGTTANDALWMQLPVLTCSGRTFASRMAGAMLTAANLEELITYDLKSYEEKAVALAAAPDRCKQIRAHLREVREHGPLFDTPRFVRNLETNLKQLVAEFGIA
jgi:predicted O-linked N-acetylglucosamine transferase (SPINDLY family)